MNKIEVETYNDMIDFIYDFVDEFSVEGNVSHDTFNRAVELRCRIIADDNQEIDYMMQ